MTTLSEVISKYALYVLIGGSILFNVGGFIFQLKFLLVCLSTSLNEWSQIPFLLSSE